jgi:hypothetical protein
MCTVTAACEAHLCAALLFRVLQMCSVVFICCTQAACWQVKGHVQNVSKYSARLN